MLHLRTHGIYHVGVLVEDTGDLYIALLGDFLQAPVLNYTSRGGALQRYLSLDCFVIQLGSMRGVKPLRRKAS